MPSSTGSRSGRGGKGYFLPGTIALVALLAIGLFFVGAGDLAHPADRRLAGADISQQIALAIQAREATTTAPAVKCPASEPVRQGYRFECARAGAAPGTASRPVYVTEVDGRGSIRWSYTPAP